MTQPSEMTLVPAKTIVLVQIAKLPVGHVQPLARQQVADLLERDGNKRLVARCAVFASAHRNRQTSVERLRDHEFAAEHMPLYVAEHGEPLSNVFDFLTIVQHDLHLLQRLREDRASDAFGKKLCQSHFLSLIHI